MPSPDVVEELLVECLTAAEARGRAGVQRILDAHPEHAEELEARLEMLADLSLFEDGPRDSVPERIGDYRPIERIGAGGMGEVFLAEQVSLKRLVALKVLRAGPLASEAATERFRREAQSVARLSHPGIVSVHAFGEHDGVAYLAMEFLPGCSLAELLVEQAQRGERLPVTDVVRWGRDVARALEAAHAASIVHRDVKPSNIRIVRDGRAILLDFGLARDLKSASLSTTGSFLGSPHYAAPEQITGERKEIGPATDVYGLGVALYEALTGRLPFDGETPEQVFHQILTREPLSPRRRTHDLPRDLETVVLRAIEKDPGRRYPSARAMADDLEAVLELRPIRARPPGLASRVGKALRRNRSVLASAVVGGALVSVLAVVVGLEALDALRRPDQILELQRLARIKLLDPSHEMRLEAYLTGREEAVPIPSSFVEGAEGPSALAFYDAALELAPDRFDIAVERAVAALASGESEAPPEWLAEHCPTTVSASNRIRAGAAALPAEELAAASRVDRRALGLLAFLLSEPELCLAAWEELDLTGEPDPLVDAAMGQLHHELSQPALAYPRLLRAFDAFGDLGFLAYAVADCACALGDLAVAERFLALAETLPLPDPWGRERCVRADLLAARGRTEEARAQFEEIWTIAQSARRHFVRFLNSVGTAEALTRAVDVCITQLTYDRLPAHLAVARETAPRWWRTIGAEKQYAELASALGVPGRESRIDLLAGVLGKGDVRELVLGRESFAAGLLDVVERCGLRWPGELERAFAALACELDARPASWASSAEAALARRVFLAVATRAGLALRLVLGPSADRVWLRRTDGTDPPGPEARAGAVFEHDPRAGRTILFGGRTGDGSWLDDTWGWDGVRWYPYATDVAPSPRWRSTSAFDSDRGVLVIFGGAGAAGPLGDTWEWDGTRWRDREREGPAPRLGHGMAYDEARRRVVLLEGYIESSSPSSGPSSWRTWLWDGTRWESHGGDGPRDMILMAVAYDAAREVVVAVACDTGAQTSTWEWDGRTWDLRFRGSAPPHRVRGAGLYDPHRQRVVAFGGLLGRLSSCAAWWEWSGEAWQAHRLPDPGERQYPSMAYDSGRGRVVFFGGVDAGPEVWELVDPTRRR